MSYVGNLTGAVDILFTYQPVMDKLQGHEENEQVQAVRMRMSG